MRKSLVGLFAVCAVLALATGCGADDEGGAGIGDADAAGLDGVTRNVGLHVVVTTTPTPPCRKPWVR